VIILHLVHVSIVVWCRLSLSIRTLSQRRGAIPHPPDAPRRCDGATVIAFLREFTDLIESMFVHHDSAGSFEALWEVFVLFWTAMIFLTGMRIIENQNDDGPQLDLWQPFFQKSTMLNI
jgi:hypothetical protein